MGQVLKLNQLLEELPKIRGDKTLVFTNGCFDILHVGHIRYLKQAKGRGDLLVVGINSDASVRRLKGPTRPIQSESDRAEILAALEAVDYVCQFDEDTPRSLIEAIRPDLLVKGGDWSVDQIVGADFVQSYGGKVESLPFIEGRSTTKIVEKASQD